MKYALVALVFGVESLAETEICEISEVVTVPVLRVTSSLHFLATKIKSLILSRRSFLSVIFN
jgi:hypothetical protein